MFGTNGIVGKKFFSGAPEAQEGKLLVTSMFMTLQGEGPYRGKPAFFIRLAKCNLSCSFCDTYFDSGVWLSYDEIFERMDAKIEEFFKGDVPRWAQFLDGYHSATKPTDRAWVGAVGSTGYYVQDKKRDMVLVITGGEPSLQENLRLFFDAAAVQFKYTQIESNGLFTQPVARSTTVVISPKCVEKQDGTATRYLTPNAEALARADCLKFVMEADPESPYSSIPQWALTWATASGKDIYISPMNVYKTEPRKAKELRALNRESTLEERSTIDEVISFWEPDLLDMEANKINHEYAANYAIRNGYIFQVQIHLLASVA